MLFRSPLPQGARSGITELARRSPVPIAYGEHLFGLDEAVEAMRSGQLQVLQPDAATCGGLAEARRMAAAAVRSAERYDWDRIAEDQFAVFAAAAADASQAKTRGRR